MSKPDHVEERMDGEVFVGKTDRQKNKDDAAQAESKAREADAKAKERLEQGKGNPAEQVLYQRQKAILANQKLIMDALDIDTEVNE